MTSVTKQGVRWLSHDICGKCPVSGGPQLGTAARSSAGPGAPHSSRPPREHRPPKGADGGLPSLHRCPAPSLVLRCAGQRETSLYVVSGMRSSCDCISPCALNFPPWAKTAVPPPPLTPLLTEQSLRSAAGCRRGPSPLKLSITDNAPGGSGIFRQLRVRTGEDGGSWAYVCGETREHRGVDTVEHARCEGTRSLHVFAVRVGLRAEQ